MYYYDSIKYVQQSSIVILRKYKILIDQSLSWYFRLIASYETGRCINSNERN